MAKAPAGWYNDPLTRGNLRWWDGNGWSIESDTREAVIALHVSKGLTIPNFDINPEKITVNIDTRSYAIKHAPIADPAMHLGWSIDDDGMLARWFDGNRWSERFHVASLFESVTPDFVENGGSSDPVGELRRQTMSKGDFDLLRLLLSRMTPDRLKSLGYAPAPHKFGPLTWIQDDDNPNLSRGWDGAVYTGEVELTSVVRSRQAVSQ